MKELKFEANLGYQQDAIRAIVDIFDGQKDCKGVFTVKKTKEEEFLKADVGGVANVLKLVDEEIEENVHRIQLRNGLAQSPTADVKTRNFSVQMETGTGKTYVYLRSVFELNKQYGFTKFIVVVPSIAIRKGVRKCFKELEEHFMMDSSMKTAIWLTPSWAWVYTVRVKKNEQRIKVRFF